MYNLELSGIKPKTLRWQSDTLMSSYKLGAQAIMVTLIIYKTKSKYSIYQPILINLV